METLYGHASVLSAADEGGLRLMIFRDPSAKGIEVLPLDAGGIVCLNWDIYAGGRIGTVDSGTVLRNALKWLSERRSWHAPVEEALLKVQGKVISAHGSPISEATVRAIVFADWGTRWGEVKALTTEDGDFSLPRITPSVYGFEVTAEGFAQEDRFAMARCEAQPANDQVVLRMRRTAALYGKVYYEDDPTKPAGDFPVSLLPADRNAIGRFLETRTDARGHFSFEKVPYGRTMLVAAEKENWAGSEIVEMPLSPQREPASVELGVFETPRVEGKVIDVDSQELIPEAKVRIEPRDRKVLRELFKERRTRVVTADSDGTFFAHLAPGTWRFHPEAEGYVGSWLQGAAGEENFLSADVEARVGPKGPEDVIVLKMKRTAAVWFYGTVYFPSAQPAPGATVRFDAGKAPSCGVYTTDPLGRYRTDRVAFVVEDEQGVQWFVFHVCCQGFASGYALELKESCREVKQDFWLKEGISISGFVRDPLGNGVEGATVFPVTRSGKRKVGEEVLSAADGSYTLRGFSPDFLANTLRAEKQVITVGTSCLYAGEVYISQLSSDICAVKLDDIEIMVARAGDIGGRALFHDGTPMRNAALLFKFFYSTGEHWFSSDSPRDRRVILNEDGEFRLRPPCAYRRLNLVWQAIGWDNWRHPNTIPPDAGKWDILVKKSGTSEDTSLVADGVVLLKGIESGTSGLEIRFPSTGTVTGRVVDEATGDPLQRFNVQMYSRDEGLPGNDAVFDVWNESVDFSDGCFRVEGLIPRSYNLEVSKKAYYSHRVEGVVVRGDDEVDVGEMVLTKFWRIFGRIVAEGSGLPVMAKAEAASKTARTYDDGYFQLKVSPVTCIRIRIIPDEPGWEEVTVDVEYQDQPETNLGEIILRPREVPNKE